ncbi:MAG: DNA topoisomerase IB [Ideonella sp.]
MPRSRAPSPTDLHWACDAEPGLRRLRHGRNFRYVDAHGKAIGDGSVLQRIKALVLPPAWSDVWICSRSDGHLQATGRDARGRKQYRYHAQWLEQRGQTKFDHLRTFGQVLPRIRQQVQRQLSGDAEPTRQRVLATLVRLLDTTWLRIGNDEYARENGSYGLSTLRRRHVVLSGAAELKLSFPGKSGVNHHMVLSDRRLARVIRRCRELPGQGLFHYVDEAGGAHRIGSADVNDWLAQAAGRRVTAKDFRTWHATVQALDLSLSACAAQQQGSGAFSGPGSVTAIVAAVARRLGNTPAVCRKAYIHPQILQLAVDLRDAQACAQTMQQRWVNSPPARSGLRVAERRLLGLLSAEKSAVRL